MKYHLSLDISFRKNPYSGLYIALEGVDGSGKTTQRKALSEYFTGKGKKAVQTTEPRLDLLGGDTIEKIFKSEQSVNPVAFQYLLTANRITNHGQIVEPALKKGELVISDRCFWSAVPYGLMDKGTDFSKQGIGLMLEIQGILSMYYQSITPDFVFYIDISPETALERSRQREDSRKKDFYETKEKLEKVVRGYRMLVKQFPEEFVIIDGEKSVEDVTRDLLKNIKNKKEKIKKYK